SEVACAVAHWLKGSSARNVFLGCAAHQPGSWWTRDERSAVTDLHATGLDSTLVTASGLLARRMGEASLYHLPLVALRQGQLRDGWTQVYQSPLGAVLMVERRVCNYSLVLTCERGLIELDVSGLPDEVREVAQVPAEPGLGVVGRIDGGAFAVTRGRVEPWGLADLTPAVLIGSPNQSLVDLPAALDAAPRRRSADR